MDRVQGTGYSQKGQSLTELVIVMAVAITIVGALVFATISTLRNTQFSKNQSQATKLAQEAIERVRIGRDRNVAFTNSFTINGGTVTDWQSSYLWGPAAISSNCSPCYFTISSTGGLQYLGTTPTNGEPIPTSPAVKVFNRVILLTDMVPADVTDFTKEKKLTAIVSWTDFAGAHESRLSTILRKI